MKKYIIITLIFGFIVSSCDTGESRIRTDVILKNNSSYIIELTVFNAGLPNTILTTDTTFLIAQNTEIIYYYSAWGDNVESFLFLPFEGVADSAIIIFDDYKQIKYRQGELNPRNILDINYWEKIKESNSYIKYTYIISDEDYDNAVNIE